MSTDLSNKVSFVVSTSYTTLRCYQGFKKRKTTGVRKWHIVTHQRAWVDTELVCWTKIVNTYRKKEKSSRTLRDSLYIFTSLIRKLYTLWRFSSVLYGVWESGWSGFGCTVDWCPTAHSVQFKSSSEVVDSGRV